MEAASEARVSRVRIALPPHHHQRAMVARSRPPPWRAPPLALHPRHLAGVTFHIAAFSLSMAGAAFIPTAILVLCRVQDKRLAYAIADVGDNWNMGPLAKR